MKALKRKVADINGEFAKQEEKFKKALRSAKTDELFKLKSSLKRSAGDGRRQVCE
jgi:hypothetical protein